MGIYLKPAGFFLSAILLCHSSIAPAASYTWTASTGDWSDAAKWGGWEQTGGGFAYVNNGGTVTITQTGEACFELNLGYYTANTGSIQINAGSLTLSLEQIGNYGTGTFTQAGGTHTVEFTLYLGVMSGSRGTYNLNSMGQLYVGYELILDFCKHQIGIVKMGISANNSGVLG